MGLPDLSKMVFQVLPHFAERIRHGFCATCAEPLVLHEFRDDLGLEEYAITGMCQVCQDTIHEEQEQEGV